MTVKKRNNISIIVIMFITKGNECCRHARMLLSKPTVPSGTCFLLPSAILLHAFLSNQKRMMNRIQA